MPDLESDIDSVYSPILLNLKQTVRFGAFHLLNQVEITSPSLQACIGILHKFSETFMSLKKVLADNLTQEYENYLDKCHSKTIVKCPKEVSKNLIFYYYLLCYRNLFDCVLQLTYFQSLSDIGLYLPKLVDKEGYCEVKVHENGWNLKREYEYSYNISRYALKTIENFVFFNTL